MAMIDGFRMQAIFPKHYAEYILNFSKEDEEALDKWTSNEQIISFNNQNKHHEKYEGNFLGDNFQTLYNFNILKTTPDFSNIHRPVLDCVNHYLKQVLKFGMPNDCHMDMADSWMVRVKGDANNVGVFRNHNHKMASITGVLFLNDSKNAFVLNKLDVMHDFHPFTWNNQPTEFTTHEIFVECKKGKLILFPSIMLHGLYRCDDPDDVRYSFAMNFWPYGTVSIEDTCKLSYQ